MIHYPFTPDFLEAIPSELVKLYEELEDRLLYEICSRLVLEGETNEVVIESIRALRAQGIDYSEIEKAITEITGMARTEFDAALDDTRRRNEEYYGSVFDAANMTKPKSIVSSRDIDAIIRQSRGEYKDLTRSMGFAVRQGGKVTKLLSPRKAFEWALDKAEMEISSNAISPRQAIDNAVRELADSGIKTVIYDKNGKRMYTQMDVAVRRAVLTGNSQICAKYNEQAAKELGTDLYEVSAHPGARDTGDGYLNHKSWQGKVYSTSDNNPKYPNIYNVCGLGQGGGLEGWNCRHRRFPFIEGVSERAYTNKQLREIDPNPFVYEGKRYTAYEATQKQREIERTVRKYKRRVKALEASGSIDEARAAKAKVARLNKEYAAFSKSADLKQRNERMRVLYG